MLVPMKDILERAKSGGYAVAAPNVINEDTARVCIEAAVELNSPMILDFAFWFHDDIMSLGRILRDLALPAAVPIAINLDHGQTFEQAIWAVRAGFTSVMVDRSSEPFEQNIAQTKALVDICHAVGVSVEAELGHVGDAENDTPDECSDGLTDPGQAAEFVNRTGVDALAVAIGTAHGQYKKAPMIDLERLKQIRKVVDVPLVLHGGSGSGDENLKKAIEYGISKINVATDLFVAGVENGKTEGPPYMIYHRIKDGYKARLMQYMHLFGQVGKA